MGKKLIVALMPVILILLCAHHPLHPQTEADKRHPLLPELDKSSNSFNAAYNAGNHTKALEHAKRMVELSEQICGKECALSAIGYTNLGVAYENMGDYDGAIEYHEKALVIDRKVGGEEHPRVAVSYIYIQEFPLPPEHVSPDIRHDIGSYLKKKIPPPRKKAP